MTFDSAPIVARAQAKRRANLQAGVVLSYTTLTHPPKQFGPEPRHIGLVELEDGTHVLAALLSPCVIGQRVLPRMQLSCVNEQGLRIYDIAYEALSMRPVATEKAVEFPGYILAFTGPAGVGKSTVNRLVASMCGGYLATVPILTTAASHDREKYRTVSVKKFEQMMQRNEIIAATRVPPHGNDWYGYRAQDIETIWRAGKLPAVITETHLLQGLADHFGRRSILSFGLLPPGKSKRTMLSHLLRRLRARGSATESFIERRLEHAEHCLQFIRERADLFDHVVVNDNAEAVASLVRKNLPGMAQS